jgi:hypothetical protein
MKPWSEHENKAKCEEAIAINVKYKPQANLYYECWPGQFDPRGPKGTK